MDQMTTTFVATQEYLQDRLQNQITDKNAKIMQLENALESARNINRSNANDMNTTRDAIQAWTLEELENNGITESQAEEIAGICGFELSKEVEVEVTVTYSLTVTAGPTDDVEDIVNNINFDTIDYDEQLITSLNASIDRIDF